MAKSKKTETKEIKAEAKAKTENKETKAEIKEIKTETKEIKAEAKAKTDEKIRVKILENIRANYGLFNKGDFAEISPELAEVLTKLKRVEKC